AQNGISTSGALVIAPRPGTATGNTLIVDTKGLVYDATNKRVGIGTAAPGAPLHVYGTYENNTKTLQIGAATSPTARFYRADDISVIDGPLWLESNYNQNVLIAYGGGNVGIGTIVPENKLEVVGTMSGRSLQITGTGAAPLIYTDQTTGRVGIGTTGPDYVFDVQHASEKINSKNGYLTDGADYAEYFDNEEYITIGSLVGMNSETGKVRRYRSGDEFIGIASDGKGYIGNGNAQVEHDPHFTLVGLLGQLTFRPEQVVLQDRIVSTKDGKRIGLLLPSGKVLLR
ncbi:MAG: hypothetical protein PHZ00_03420, partial [Candidatus Peribacteraceae bacterium]|nr:hypothetical protein [Candidatus Peribacteraceae bacterium]